MQNDPTVNTPINESELNFSPGIYSANKYGFFLCLSGSARILLGHNTYIISDNCLCVYTLNTFVQVLEKSNDFGGIIQSGEIDEYYQAVSSINIRNRLSIRNNTVVRISPEESAEIVSLCRCLTIREDEAGSELLLRIRRNYSQCMRNALCLKIYELYFSHSPETATPQDREDIVFNRFLISAFENCHRERTVRFYAEMQNLSPYYFSQIIRAKSGKSALQWIEIVTMTFARHYLNDSSISIKEIAGRLSFPDQSTFGRYFLPWIFREVMLPLTMRWFKAIIDDKNRMEPMIKASGLDWTIVRCTTVKDIPSKGHVTASLDGKGLKFSIAAPDMARFVVEQLNSTRYLHKAPAISN